MSKGELHNIAKAHLEKLNATGTLNIDKLSSRLKEMINYAISRHDWYEGQRGKYLSIAIALIAVSATGTLILSKISTHIDHNAIVFFLIALMIIILGSFYIIFKFGTLIEGNYPHREHADIRSWYFRYNINSSKNITDQFNFYVKSWLEYATDIDFAAEDLEQVFILFIIQWHRSKNLNCIKTNFTISMLVATLFIFIGIIVQLCSLY
ncbi:MAG: hypothetical protein AB7E51_10040 [Pseudodesulfovibrio sp.]|uniref:hypothetical protein n=1 Tax=Pseudodesulfovibrio sp. TaxID=2035812 RepID=UPI003D11FB6D